MGKYPKIRELVDQDYWHKLSDADREYLKKFNSEFYYGYFNTGEYEKKRKNLHSTKDSKKQVRRKVKIQNQDIFIHGTPTGDKKK